MSYVIKNINWKPYSSEGEHSSTFLLSLEYLNTDGFEVHYLFIDDNENEDSRNILLDFAERHHTAQILSSSDHQKYICDENTHYWNEHLIWKVADFKMQLFTRQFKRILTISF